MLEFCLWIGVLIVVLVSTVISIPILFITSPVWVPLVLGLSLIIWLFGWTHKVSNLLAGFYDWLFFKSDKPRKFMWRNFYNVLCWLFPQDEWKTMNYGYAINSESGHSIVLAEDEENERFSYQLYHYLATGFKKNANLQGLAIVEVGSGRGGGLGYVVKNLKPDKALGVDYSKQQVEFCKKTYLLPNIAFVWGDAENLPIESGSVNMVINVESSHCYGNFDKFIREVARILKDNGTFMITDFITTGNVPIFEETLKKYLEIAEKKDITENVLLSLRFDSKRRMDLIVNRTPRFLRGILKRFSGAEGSNIYQDLEARRSVYLAYKLTKKS